jgi:hypothetical protein
MFDAALGALFRSVARVDEVGGTGPPYDDLDVIVVPKIDAFEFSLPRQSRSDQYAVWIRYNLVLHEPGGEPITDWLVSAYGQADAKLLRGGGAMEAAVIRAMRDAIANIVIGFPEEPNIRAALFPGQAVAESAAEPTKELAAQPLPADAAQPDATAEKDAPAEDSAEEEGPTGEIQS